MKKIHCISLNNSLTIKENPYRLFINLLSLYEKIPKVNTYFFGAIFPSVVMSTEFAFEVVEILSGRFLKDLSNKEGSRFNPLLGNEELLASLDPKHVSLLLDKYSRWWQVEHLVADCNDFLVRAENSINGVFSKMNSGDECLTFTLFPFAEIIYERFSVKKEEPPIFKFLEGFSLIQEDFSTRVTAEILCCNKAPA